MRLVLASVDEDKLKEHLAQFCLALVPSSEFEGEVVGEFGRRVLGCLWLRWQALTIYPVC